MGFESDDQRLRFLRDFGSTIQTPGGDCLGIVDTEYMDTEGIDNFLIAMNVRTSDVAALLPKGTPVTIDGTDYCVSTHKPDGTGMSVILLVAP